MILLTLPSGLKVSPAKLYRYLENLSQRDVEAIDQDKIYALLRPELRKLLGKAFAYSYRKRRAKKTKKDIDWWNIQGGKFRKKFSTAAMRARINGYNPEYLIYATEEFAKSKGLSFPSPNLVCGDWAFSRLEEMSEARREQIFLSDTKILPEDHGESTWSWQPGYRWCKKTGMFVKC